MRDSIRTTWLAAAAMLLLIPAAARAADTADGFRYVLHSAQPPAQEFDAPPSSFDRVGERFVMQGPEHTLIWSRKNQVGDVGRVGFARGERRMGLFLPLWDDSSRAEDATGWSDYGKPVTYESFEVDLQRGDDDRTIAGAAAKHYRLEVDLVSNTGGDSVNQHITVSSNLWLIEAKPFSWAPFATAGVFGEPRMRVAMHERLAPLGMVARAETVHARQTVDADGGKLGYPHDGTYLSWISGLEPVQVPVVDVPVGSEALISKLRDASRADPAGTCEALAAGRTPAFVSELLNDAQQAAFVPELERQCERLAARKRDS